jgi:hypothetical protein
MTSKHIVTRARIEGLVIVLVALGYLWETQRIPELFQMPGVPGPTAFPTLIGLIFGAAGLWRLIGLRREPAPEAEQGRAHGDGSVEPSPRGAGSRWLAADGRFYAMWAVLLAYLGLMPFLGFPLATPVALAALFALLGERRWGISLGLSLATTIVMYAVFAWGLAVQLPLGLVESLVK